MCGSGDISWCNISLRPHCNDCSHWGQINYSGKVDATILHWNMQYTNTPKQDNRIVDIIWYVGELELIAASYRRQIKKKLNGDVSRLGTLESVISNLRSILGDDK